MNDQYYPVPQPDEIEKREKEDAMGAYLMMFAALGAGLPLPIINLIAAVVYYFVNAKKSLFVKFHALQSLLSQFPTSILNAVAVFWGIRIAFYSMPFSDIYKGYLWVTLLANLIYIIFSIIGAVKARKGHMYYFLFFGPLCYQMTFKKGKESEEVKVVNAPPKL